MPIILEGYEFDGTYLILQEQVDEIACYKSALIDLELLLGQQGRR